MSPRHGSVWNVVGSGYASRSDSKERLNPSIADPSNPIPSVNAPSTSAGAIATDFSVPTTSVNQSLTNLTPRSSMVRRTKSRCLSIHTLSRTSQGSGSATAGAPTPDAACARLATCQSSP